MSDAIHNVIIIIIIISWWQKQKSDESVLNVVRFINNLLIIRFERDRVMCFSYAVIVISFKSLSNICLVVLKIMWFITICRAIIIVTRYSRCGIPPLESLSLSISSIGITGVFFALTTLFDRRGVSSWRASWGERKPLIVSLGRRGEELTTIFATSKLTLFDARTIEDVILSSWPKHHHYYCCWWW